MFLPRLQNAANIIANSLSVSAPEYVGKGAFKETYKVVNVRGELIALKIFDPAKFNRDRTEREISAMTSCNHKCTAKVLKFDSCEIDCNASYNYMLEEYYDGGSLTDRLKYLTPKNTARLAVNIISAIGHLRSLDLVHRDIKPDNIMFKSTDDDAVLVDFGLVRNIGMESLTASWIPQGPGTPLYSAPEQLNNDKCMIDWRTDQFSLGVMLCIIITGLHPMQRNSTDRHDAICRVSRREAMSDSIKGMLDQRGFGFVAKMLSPWPVQRYNCDNKLLECANNVWSNV